MILEDQRFGLGFDLAIAAIEDLRSPDAAAYRAAGTLGTVVTWFRRAEAPPLAIHRGIPRLAPLPEASSVAHP